MKLLADNNIPHIHFHDLRHSCASFLLKSGGNLKEVSSWLGHSSINITADTYLHLDVESKRDSINRLTAMLEKTEPKSNRNEKCKQNCKQEPKNSSLRQQSA